MLGQIVCKKKLHKIQLLPSVLDTFLTEMAGKISENITTGFLWSSVSAVLFCDRWLSLRLADATFSTASGDLVELLK